MNELLKGEKTDAMLNRDDNFISNYSIGQKIGQGTFGDVHLCKHMRSQKLRAVRILYKKLMDDVTVNQFMTEILLLVNLDHPGVVRFIEIFQDKEMYYIVNELCLGGDLLREI